MTKEEGMTPEEYIAKLEKERDNCLKEVKLCYSDIHGLEGQISDLEEENQKLKSEGVVIGGEDHKNYIDFEEYLKLQKEKEELEKEVERLQKVLYTITGSRDDGEPDLYEDC